MTVLCVHENSAERGGSEVYIRDVSSELEKSGIKNILLFIEDHGYEFGIFFNHEQLPKIRKTNLIYFLDQLLKDYSIDLVHMHGLSDIQTIDYFLSRYKVVRTMHEPRMVCPGYSKFWVSSGKPCTIKFGYHCFYHAYSQKCFRSRKPLSVLKEYRRVEFEVANSKRYAAILTMSEFIRNEAIKGGISADKVICNPPFTYFKLPFSPFEEMGKRFLFVGRLIEHKGIHYLLSAILPVLQRYTDARLYIVGDGPLYHYVMDFIDKNQVRGQIIVEKWKSSSEISELMKKSYCILFPSIYPEAFGLVGIEAAMHSKPVIAFNVGGVSTWLKDQFNGFLLNEISIFSFSDAIQKMIDNPGLYRKMSKNAWELASSYFTSERHISMLMEIYHRCITL